MDASSIFAKSQENREKGEFLQALMLTDEALLAFQKENNLAKVAEVHASRALILRHVYEQTNDISFLISAKHTAMAGVEIVEKNGASEALVVPLYTLGKVHESLGEFEAARDLYKRAIEAVPSSPDVNPAVVAEMKTRFEAVEYRLGDDSALARFEQALGDLNAADDEAYNKNVWVSGAHMHMARAMIAKGEKDKAQKHIDEAEKIITFDHRLTLRKNQLAKLKV